MKLLKESKTLLGFLISFILSLLAIILAVLEIDYWVTALVISQILLWFMVYRADKFYYSNYK